MTPADRLRAAIHMESAAIAPQTSPLIEAAKEVLAENERLRDAVRGLGEIGDVCTFDELGAVCSNCRCSRRVTQQQAVNSEEGE